MHQAHTRRTAGILTLGLALLATACAHPVRRDVYQDGGIQVFLRSESGLFSGTVQKHYSHPITIAPVRMAHILSRIDIRRGSDKERTHAIPTEILYSVAEGVAQALAEAGPDEAVIAQSVVRTKRFHLFDRQFLTNFLLYARGEQLYVHLSRSDWPVPPRRKEKLPEPEVGKHPMDFKIFPGTAMSLVDRQSVVVEWRDPIFREPTRTRITAGGEVVRKEILAESPPEDWVENEAPAPNESLEDLSPETLRALADLEERRRAGRVTEAEYRRERREILR